MKFSFQGTARAKQGGASFSFLVELELEATEVVVLTKGGVLIGEGGRFRTHATTFDTNLLQL